MGRAVTAGLRGTRDATLEGMKPVICLPALLLILGPAGCQKPDRSPTLAPEAGTTHLTSAAPGSRADDELDHQVEERVSNGRTERDSNGVQVSAHNGVVTLRGTVPSILEKERVYRVAAETPGVASVDNQLVAPEPTPSPQSDDDISRTIQEELAHRGATDVTLTVSSGDVVLGGYVPTNIEKAEIQTFASQVQNVSRVDDQIRVRPLSKP
jgi:osmotically-inducible protein OsmY